MIGLISFGFFLLITFAIYRWLAHYFWLRKVLKIIPAPKQPLFLGFSWLLMRIPTEDRMKYLVDMCFQYQTGIVVAWLGTEPVIIVRKPRHIEAILSSFTLLTKGSVYKHMQVYLGHGLITSTGDKWFQHRRLLTPAFHFNILEEYASVMQEVVEILNEDIATEVEKSNGKPIDICKIASKHTLNIICKTAMGINNDSQKKFNDVYVTEFQRFAKSVHERVVRPWLKWNSIYYLTPSGKQSMKSVKTMHNFTENVIKEKQEERKANKLLNKTENNDLDEFGKRKRKAFLDLLLDTNEKDNPLTIQELREEVETFMFAGHDTTATAISFGLFALGNNPEVQAKVHEELKEVFGDSEATATTKQLGQLKYLDRVIKEILRFYPSVPSISRTLDHDTFIDNYFIPKGCSVTMHIYILHHDPEVWPDPETFDPDRFLPENSQGRHSYAYVPFSAGPRNCIGQKFAFLEIKTVLTAILRKWKVTSVLKPSEIKMSQFITLCPSNGKLELYFTPI